MESTGVYWYHLYTILLDYGLEVYLVNARAVKHVPGRKSDISDAQWLQHLHACGLLNPCFQPDNLTRSLRCYVRERKILIKEMSRQTQRMQKAPTDEHQIGKCHHRYHGQDGPLDNRGRPRRRA